MGTSLNTLVQNYYRGEANALVDATQRLYDDLILLQAKKLYGPRVQYRHLRSEWPAEKCEELDRMMKAMSISFLSQMGVRDSVIYHDDTSIYAVPVALPAGITAGGLAGAIAVAIAMGGGAVSIAIGAAATLGLAGLVSAFEASLNENSFGKLGRELFSQANRYAI